MVPAADPLCLAAIPCTPLPARYRNPEPHRRRFSAHAPPRQSRPRQRDVPRPLQAGNQAGAIRAGDVHDLRPIPSVSVPSCRRRSCPLSQSRPTLPRSCMSPHRRAPPATPSPDHDRIGVANPRHGHAMDQHRHRIHDRHAQHPPAPPKTAHAINGSVRHRNHCRNKPSATRSTRPLNRRPASLRLTDQRTDLTSMVSRPLAPRASPAIHGHSR